MSYTFQAKVGKYTYLFEGISYRNEQGEARNRRKRIATLDQKSGKWRYTEEYREQAKQEGLSLTNAWEENEGFSRDDIRSSTIKDYGMYYLLEGIAEQSGLLEALAQASPERWQTIFMLACYLLVSGDPPLYCADWLERTENMAVGPMSSQDISDLLADIEPEERNRFYHQWYALRQEKEYLALDITSVSSYSELIDDVEWGHNRDGEDLKQVNICMLMGEESRLPIYHSVYSGSLHDVSTLRTTCHAFRKVTDAESILLVMDKGFYSKANIDDMLTGGYRFLIPVKFSSSYTIDIVESVRKDMDSIENTVMAVDDGILRGMTKTKFWNDETTLFMHVFFNTAKALKERNELFADIAAMRIQAEANPEECSRRKEYKQYLNIRRSHTTKSGYTVHVRTSEVNKKLRTVGWLVMISNDVEDKERAISLYRNKDVVEKGFLRLKKNLDLGRLRVHSQERAHNKVFIGFIALILLSHIHNVMLTHNMYKDRTMKQLILTLSKLRVQTIREERILYPVTKEQRKIYEAFGLPIPV